MNDVEVFVSFTGPNGEFLLGSVEVFQLGVAFTSLNSDRPLVLDADGTVSVADRDGALPASVEIFHRSPGSGSTLSTSVQPVTGPWVLPGAERAVEVGTVLVIERGETGEVLAVRGSAIGGVGTMVNFADLGAPAPGSEARSVFGDLVGSSGWGEVRRVPVDDRFDALAAQSGDQRAVCLALRDPESDGAAVTCSPTWRFLQRGITLRLGFQDGAAVSMVLLPVSVTDDQVAEVGHTVANGQILVLDPAPPSRLEIQTPDGLLVLRLGP
ncbi:MAG: hypothetical protein GY926_08860 [bacterium]|nr:hypothetical protein [bacterium]